MLLQATFQVLPIFVAYDADASSRSRPSGRPVLLLIWLYVMANVIVLGAEVNWW